MKRLSMLVVTAVGASMGGCGGPPKQADNLAEAIRSYNDGVRWQRYAIAATKILPKQRGEFVDEMDERAEDLRFTDYEIVRVDARGDKEARVQIKMTWYLDSEGVVRDTTAVQTWERHGKQWFMVDEQRQRGAAMPGLADRQAHTTADDPAGDAQPPADPGQRPYEKP